MALVDADGVILHANQALSDLTRLSLDRLSGRSLDDLVQRLTTDEELAMEASPGPLPTSASLLGGTRVVGGQDCHCERQNGYGCDPEQALGDPLPVVQALEYQQALP